MSNGSDKDTSLWHFWKCPIRCGDRATSESRTKIINAAYEEIHRVGFQAASISNILKKTSLSKGALYHHFSNKNELGIAVINEVVERSVYEAWIAPLEEADDPIDALQQIIIAAGKQITAEDIVLGCPLSNLSQEMSNINEQFRDQLQNIYSKWMLSIENSIESGKQKGYVAQGVNGKQFATVFVATLEGCIALAKNSKSKKLLIDCGSGLVNLLTTLRPQKSGDTDV